MSRVEVANRFQRVVRPGLRFNQSWKLVFLGVSGGMTDAQIKLRQELKYTSMTVSSEMILHA